MQDFETEISIDDLAKFWIRKPTQVIHCGAHLAEEADDYALNLLSPVIWIEAAPNLIPRLKARVEAFPLDSVIQAALWSETGIQKIIHISNNSFSSSFKELGTHADSYPEIEYVKDVLVSTSTLDSLNLPVDVGALIVLDMQGIEYEVLTGGTLTIKRCSFLYIEVSKGELYQNQIPWYQITSFLKSHGFHLVDWQYSNTLEWGNALYSRRKTPFQKVTRFRRLLQHNLRRRLGSQP